MIRHVGVVVDTIIPNAEGRQLHKKSTRSKWWKHTEHIIMAKNVRRENAHKRIN